MKPTTPFGFNTRRASFNAADISGMKNKDEAHKTASKLLSGKSKFSASPIWNWRLETGGNFCLATASISSEISMPIIFPFAPILSAASKGIIPVPVATSNTRAPADRFASSIRRRAVSCRKGRASYVGAMALKTSFSLPFRSPEPI